MHADHKLHNWKVSHLLPRMMCHARRSALSVLRMSRSTLAYADMTKCHDCIGSDVYYMQAMEEETQYCNVGRNIVYHQFSFTSIVPCTYLQLRKLLVNWYKHRSACFTCIYYTTLGKEAVKKFKALCNIGCWNTFNTPNKTKVHM